MEIKEIYQNYPLALLLEADPDIKKIEKYLNKGHCFALYQDDEIIGIYVLKDLKDGTCEIMNLAVKENYRNQGLAKKLLEDAKIKAHEQGFESLIIATGKDSFQQKLYTNFGFEVFEIIKDYFTKNYKETIIDNGVVLTDLVRLKIKF